MSLLFQSYEFVDGGDDSDDRSIEKCMGCGRYFHDGEAWANAVRASANGDRRPYPQLCVPCIRHDPAPHEY